MTLQTDITQAVADIASSTAFLSSIAKRAAVEKASQPIDAVAERMALAMRECLRADGCCTEADLLRLGFTRRDIEQRGDKAREIAGEVSLHLPHCN